MTTHKDFIENKREQEIASNIFQRSETPEEAETKRTLSADVERFLSSGGQIEVLPFGVPKAEKKLDREEAKEYMRGLDAKGRKKGGAHVYAEQTYRNRKAKGEVE